MLIETLAALIELANATRKFLSRPEAKNDHLLGDKLSKALRTIYFPPEVVLGFLLELGSVPR
jgi:hypothetical protein